MELRERVARKIAYVISDGADVETIVIPTWPQLPQLRCGLTMAPRPDDCAPLWKFFLTMADVVIAEMKDYIDEGS